MIYQYGCSSIGLKSQFLIGTFYKPFCRVNIALRLYELAVELKETDEQYLALMIRSYEVCIGNLC